MPRRFQFAVVASSTCVVLLLLFGAVRGHSAPADNPYTQTHVVQSGDTLSKIAEKYYGDASLYPKIFQANRDVLSDPNKIRPGQKLRIP